ncbi:hypothetical protein EVAR_53820_1 [Eumeta japonica]|uniref:Uncharacterized protein n=1 Tax=Eumeta variegata TaxID=151549 RepID=A0A4C1YLD5_EUMVA|nr:hypothetical protein EVAR_53820_1 [Eumeta japonica]
MVKGVLNQELPNSILATGHIARELYKMSAFNVILGCVMLLLIILFTISSAARYYIKFTCFIVASLIFATAPLPLMLFKPRDPRNALDQSRSGRPVTNKVDAILEKVEQHRHISSYDATKELGIDHKRVLTHLKKGGYTKSSRLGSHTSSLREM